MSVIQPYVFEFLHDLKNNNNRDWFNSHKERYQTAYDNVAEFTAALIGEMSKTDYLEPLPLHRSMYRIYRDLRFSKDKTPYKVYFGGRLRRAARFRRGGYYFHIEPGNTFLSAGFLNPEREDLKRIRTAFASAPGQIRDIMQQPDFRDTWGTSFYGEALKTAPRGFDPEHPAIDLIRMKQFRLIHRVPDEVVLSEDFLFETIKAYLILRPFLDYMSEVLTAHLQE